MALMFRNECKVADTYVHVNIDSDTKELVAEIHSAMGETITYDMYEIVATIQTGRNREDKQLIDLLLMFIASGTTNTSRNSSMFAELAYYVSNLR